MTCAKGSTGRRVSLLDTDFVSIYLSPLLLLTFLFAAISDVFVVIVQDDATFFHQPDLFFIVTCKTWILRLRRRRRSCA